jgi:probable HAF family extracellular repeat protein
VSFAVLLIIVVMSSLSTAQQYTVTDLGTLPGGKTSGASAINDFGQVVGGAGSTGGNRAFLWSRTSGMQDLGLLHSNDGFSTAYAINNLGQVAGQSGSFAFVWTSGTMQDIGSLGNGGSLPYGINNSGQAVGSSVTTNNQGHAFFWSATGGMQDRVTLCDVAE